MNNYTLPILDYNSFGTTTDYFKAGWTDPVDQAALQSFYQGLTGYGFLGLSWDTTVSICGNAPVVCSLGKVYSMCASLPLIFLVAFYC